MDDGTKLDGGGGDWLLPENGGTSIPASLDAWRECIDEVSELTGDDNVVGDDEVDEFDCEENDGEMDGDILSAIITELVLVNAEKDWSVMGDKLEVSVNADESDIESVVVARLVLAALFNSNDPNGTLLLLIDNEFEKFPFPSELLNMANDGVLGETYLNGK